ncbi:hypothetical protein ACFPIJ_62885 [Dactylosporangium cerinum]|uniref:Uncharacterized protein n=1 Tax=Dactylosporangium cerinum TaxID=1434730 RepID=A0ABV9WLN9_9ACTN
MAKATAATLSRPSGSSPLPELKASWWESHSVALANVRFGAMARRLPTVLRQVTG